MAAALWGKVYWHDRFAGELRQEPGGRCVFTYDPNYLASDDPAIARTLAKRSTPHLCEQGLHPFFDNLVAEGWLRNAQARSLKVSPDNRLALLLAFGHDCAGAVSVIDPAPLVEPSVDLADPTAAAALESRASLSGVQPKLLATREGRRFRPARRDETSTYIAKLPAGALVDIVENEYLATAAVHAFLPDDETVEPLIAPLDGVHDRALMVPRFDRLPSGTKRHFEEFNQLLARRSGDDKYDAAYEDMTDFILKTDGCAKADAWRLYRRVLVCVLIGNTDAHLKNFAMFHTSAGMRLTPAYDLVAAALYPEYQQLALRMAGASDLAIGDVKPKHMAKFGEACRLSPSFIGETVKSLDARRAAAAEAVTKAAAKVGAEMLGNKLIELMERRWNGSFASIGSLLSKKR